MQLLRLTNAAGGDTYAQWVPPPGAQRAPVMVLAMPYEGIDWTGEAVDQCWAAPVTSVKRLGVVATGVHVATHLNCRGIRAAKQCVELEVRVSHHIPNAVLQHCHWPIGVGVGNELEDDQAQLAAHVTPHGALADVLRVVAVQHTQTAAVNV